MNSAVLVVGNVYVAKLEIANMSNLKDRMEKLDREIERYKPNNPTLQVGKNVLRLLRDELKELWVAVGNQDLRSKAPAEPAPDEVETPKTVKSSIGVMPPKPKFSKLASDDPRIGKTLKPSGGIDELINDLRGKGKDE